MTFRFVLFLCSLALCLPAAQRRPTGDDEGMQGEAVALQDAAAQWARQVDQVEDSIDRSPVFSGAYVWRGRADENYKPFHKWELRVRGGGADCSALRCRVWPLAPDMKPLINESPWSDLGGLAGDGEVSASIKLNTPNVERYRIELAWQGGEASYFTSDLERLPLREHEGRPQAKLVVAATDYEYYQRYKVAELRFWLVNNSDEPATGVVHTVEFLNEAGEVVHAHEYQPGEKTKKIRKPKGKSRRGRRGRGTQLSGPKEQGKITEAGLVPAHFSGKIVFIAEKVPDFFTVQVKTRSDQDEAGLGTGFSGAEELEIGFVTLGPEGLQARVRNGFPEALQGVTVHLELFDAEGGLLEALAIPIATIAREAEQAIAAELQEGTAAAFAGFGMSYEIEAVLPDQ